VGVEIPMAPRADLGVVINAGFGKNGQKQKPSAADIHHVAYATKSIFCRLFLEKTNVFIDGGLGKALCKQIANVRRPLVFAFSDLVDGKDPDDLSDQKKGQNKPYKAEKYDKINRREKIHFLLYESFKIGYNVAHGHEIANRAVVDLNFKFFFADQYKVCKLQRVDAQIVYKLCFGLDVLFVDLQIGYQYLLYAVKHAHCILPLFTEFYSLMFVAI
jgi:hypothetical protein